MVRVGQEDLKLVPTKERQHRDGFLGYSGPSSYSVSFFRTCAIGVILLFYSLNLVA